LSKLVTQFRPGGHTGPDGAAGRPGGAPGRIDKGFRGITLIVVPRTLIVGDVHGCADELEELLARAAFGQSDRLAFVGDLVARGPKSQRVLALVGQTHALAVLGNHEERLIEVRRARARGERGPRLGPSHEKLFAELEPEHWDFMEALPRWVDLPEHGARIVHAGVVPGVAIEAQDAWVLTHLRTIQPDGTPSDRRGETLWGALYAESPHVVFGHNAVDGLQLYPFATGLDTGCVYGNALSALVLPAGAALPRVEDRRDCIVSVKARAAYVDMRPGA
jgi:Calcineurin-like phosphoesterase